MRHKKKYGFSIFLVLLVLVYAWGYFDDPARDTLRFRATGYNGHFTEDPAESFQQYIKTTTENVKLARAAGHVDASNTVVAENSPAALFPDSTLCKMKKNGKYENGILLVHGLFDSPYPMQMLGKFFQSKCFVVYVILLPGHGTVPGDLLHTTYNDWIAATHFGTKKLLDKADNIYLGGFSLGGLLAIHEALVKPSHIKGLFLFAPALKMKTHLTPLIPIVYWASKVIQRLQWWSIEPDSATLRYQSIPINPVYQTNQLMRIVRKKLTKEPLTIPLFVEESAQDATVDPDALLDFFRRGKNPYSLLLWYYEHGPYPLLHDLRIQPIHSDLPTQRILSMSHLSFTLSPNDPIYGLNGEYKDCLAYTLHSKNWDACEAGGDDVYWGEVTTQDLKTHIIRRITFNPFYDYFIERMSTFLSPAMT